MEPTQEQLRHVEAEARMVLRNVPGVEVVAVERRTIHVPEHVNRGSFRAAHVKYGDGAQIVMTGWSASLHGVHLVEPIEDPTNPIPELVVLRDRQRRRSGEGARFGAHLPFSVRHPSMDDGQGPSTEIAHMTCDRAALAILMEQHDHDPRVVADHLRRIVSHLAHGIDAGPDRMSGRRIVPSVAFDGFVLRGNVLSVPAPLPHNVMAQAGGRPLCDVVGIRPDLARRIIRDVEADERSSTPSTLFHLSSDQVLLGDKLLL